MQGLLSRDAPQPMSPQQPPQQQGPQQPQTNPKDLKRVKASKESAQIVAGQMKKYIWGNMFLK